MKAVKARNITSARMKKERREISVMFNVAQSLKMRLLTSLPRGCYPSRMENGRTGDDELRDTWAKMTYEMISS